MSDELVSPAESEEQRWDVWAVDVGGKRQRIAHRVFQPTAWLLVEATRRGANAPYVGATMRRARKSP